MLEFDLSLALGDFELKAQARLGSTTAVFGPSGAGKTTLLEAVAGLRRGRGRITLAARPLQDTENRLFLPPEKRRVGYVPQSSALFPHMSVRHNLLFGRRPLFGWWGKDLQDGADEELQELVEALDLRGLLHRYPRFLSGGESRRVALGRALLGRPRLLLLDEPTAGLDAKRARQVRGRIRQVTERFGIPLLVVTHRQEDALALAEEVLLLERGRIVAQGPTHQILTHREALARHPDERSANLLKGTVESHDPAGGVTLIRPHHGVDIVIRPGQDVDIAIPYHPDLEPGSPLLLTVDAEEVLVATHEPQGLSARNTVRGKITHLESMQGSVYVRVGSWLVRLTAAAAQELELAEGRLVWLVVKTHSWRVLAS